MPIDYSSFSTDDLMALKAGDYGKVSTNTLLALKGAEASRVAPNSLATDPLNPTADEAAATEQARRKFVDDTGTVKTQAKEVVKTAGRTLSTAAKNIPGSTARLAKNIITPILSPVETGTNLLSAFAGGVGDALGAVNPAWKAPSDQSTEAFNNLKGAYKQRYGGIKNISDTFAEDPVGTVADAVSLASFAKGAARKVGVLQPKPQTAPAPARIGGETVKGKAADLGIPTTLGEQTANPALQRIETLNEKIPFSGMTNYRKKQATAADQAAKDMLGKYIADPNAADIAAGNRDFVSGMYNEVKGMVNDLPGQAITPSKTRPIAAQLLTRYPDIFKKMQDTKTEGLINDIVAGTRTRTENIAVGAEPGIVAGHGAKPAQKLLLGADGKPITQTITPTLTFDEAWTLRQGLGEKIGQARKLLANGAIDHTSYSQLKQLFGAVSDDLDSWAASINKPEISQKFKEANGAYRQYVVKHDIIQRAYDKAAGTVGAGETFSPKTFSTALKNIAYKDKALKNFTPQEIHEMTGLANIMQVVKRAGQFRENVPTGNRMADALGLAALTKLPTLPIAWTTTFLTTTDTGQSLLRRASALNPTSPAMGKILMELYQIGKISNSTQSDPLGIRNAN